MILHAIWALGCSKVVWISLINCGRNGVRISAESRGSELFSKNLKIVVDNLIVSCIVCFRISPFTSKKVEVIIPTPTNAQIVRAINKADEYVSSNAIAFAMTNSAVCKNQYRYGFCKNLNHYTPPERRAEKTRGKNPSFLGEVLSMWIVRNSMYFRNES